MRISKSDSNPVDFCPACFPSESEAEEKFGNVGGGPDERGNCFDYDIDHPEYDTGKYHCFKCRKRLTGEDP